MKTRKPLRCRLGLHTWSYWGVTHVSEFVTTGVEYRERQCMLCDTRQQKKRTFKR